MNSNEKELVDQTMNGDPTALGSLLELHRDRLSRMIKGRIDPRLAARVDTSDVVQEVHLEVIKRIHEFIAKPEVPFFTWVRFLAKQKMAEIARHNITTQARDVRRECIASQEGESSLLLSRYLEAKVESPSKEANDIEVKEFIALAIASLEPSDQDVLFLRHAEQLTAVETAAELGISPNTCRQRHVRALQRLKQEMIKHKLTWSF